MVGRLPGERRLIRSSGANTSTPWVEARRDPEGIRMRKHRTFRVVVKVNINLASILFGIAAVLGVLI